MDAFPEVRTKIEAVAQQRARENRVRVCEAVRTSLGAMSSLRQGLMEAQSLLVLDLEKCTRCDHACRPAPTRTTA